MALVVDGLENFPDSTRNPTLSEDMLQMALAVRNPRAVNALVSAYAGRQWHPVIQWVTKTARGFRSAEHFKTAISFHCGGLDLHPHEGR